jgi:hypothetical protein
MAQVWADLLFAHWEVEAGSLRKLIPAGLELDTFEGAAFVGVVPFRMSGVRMRGLPPLPGLSAFPELNVRSYVTDGSKPGVWFFSLDAANAPAVATARRTFHLPYYNASMSCRRAGGWIEYESRRIHRGAPKAAFRGRYRPAGAVAAVPLDRWLTERYCLYAADGRGRLRRAEVHHARWPLESAEAEIDENTMAAPLGLALEGRPRLLFARRLEVVVWTPVPV